MHVTLFIWSAVNGVTALDSSATLKPKLVVAIPILVPVPSRSPLPSLPISFSLPPSLPAPSPVLETGSEDITPRKVFEIPHRCS